MSRQTVKAGGYEVEVDPGAGHAWILGPRGSRSTVTQEEARSLAVALACYGCSGALRSPVPLADSEDVRMHVNAVARVAELLRKLCDKPPEDRRDFFASLLSTGRLLDEHMRCVFAWSDDAGEVSA